jgi:hypothetical protein
MRRIDDYRENAQACRNLAAVMSGKVREHLLAMANEWARAAQERERLLSATDAGNEKPLG